MVIMILCLLEVHYAFLSMSIYKYLCVHYNYPINNYINDDKHGVAFVSANVL
jgi:hypothetical protein